MLEKVGGAGPTPEGPKEPEFHKGDHVILNEELRDAPGIRDAEDFSFEHPYVVLGVDVEAGYLFICSNKDVSSEAVADFNPTYSVSPRPSRALRDRYGYVAALRFDEVHRAE